MVRLFGLGLPDESDFPGFVPANGHYAWQREAARRPAVVQTAGYIGLYDRRSSDHIATQFIVAHLHNKFRLKKMAWQNRIAWFGGCWRNRPGEAQSFRPLTRINARLKFCGQLCVAILEDGNPDCFWAAFFVAGVGASGGFSHGGG